MHEVLKRLAEPFPSETVDWRAGAKTADGTSALALAYIDARAVAARLDEVMGVHWQCEYQELRAHARNSDPDGDARRGKTRHSPSILVCRIGLSFDEGGSWIWRSDGSGDSDYEPEKGALSGAFKRAAVKWGIGAYLYGFPSPWVRIKHRGQTAVIDEAEKPKLARLADEALSRYRAAPAVVRPHVVEPEPERATFTQSSPTVRAEPSPTHVPAPSLRIAGLLNELKAATNLDQAAEVMRRARAQLSGKVLAPLEAHLADRVVAAIERASAQTIEAIVSQLRGFRPAKEHEGRVRAALDKRRRELAS
jgi:hypothetical protein